MSNESDCSITTLRQELKVWEKSFAAANGGRRAGREDIKQAPAIAAKYREYDRLKRPKQAVQSSPTKSRHVSSAPSPLKHASNPFSAAVASTPSKRSSTMSFKSPLQPSPAREPSPTPQAIRQFLGPTPQKDGQILSLFDDITTPSKPRNPLSSVDANIAATPSKASKISIFQSPQAENARCDRTPASSGKRFLLDAFATPLKRKREDEQGTPSSIRGSAETPAFLRRVNMNSFASGLDTLAEDDELTGARGKEPPFKKRGLVRSLSAIIRNLKEQEEEQADEELELMREMEAEAEGGPTAQKPVRHEQSATTLPQILVEDSQVVMPLGPDRGFESEEDEDVDDGLDANGQPRRIWKKKGQKRTTRRVIMRPTRRPNKTESQTQEDNHTLQIVHETQLLDQQPTKIDDEDAALSASEDGEYDDSVAAKQKKSSSLAKSGKDGQDEGGGRLKKAARKISASAHANFCKLKIKNKNSKANGRGRFGRR